ncbi:hypothetical protein [Geopseudomonas aromaticivorans]
MLLIVLGARLAEKAEFKLALLNEKPFEFAVISIHLQNEEYSHG